MPTNNDLIQGLDDLIADAEGTVATLKEAKLKLLGRKKAGRKREEAAGRKRGRRKQTRAVQALKMIEDKPGIGASEVAKEMNIRPNYLYGVLGKLEDQGKIKKTGPRSYEPVAS